ncbi:hypothetical protein KAR91_27145 [Candidatus Pacearchaeota archaeon]|nr:hypothetical protein [Candidatus Pacearchaeota archaeon]
MITKPGAAFIDLTPYFYKPGLPGGQVAISGVDSGDDHHLISTAHAEKGFIIFGEAGSSIYDEVNDFWGLGTDEPVERLHVVGNAMIVGELNMTGNAIIDVDYMDFDLENGIIHQEGRLSWNDDDGTLNVGLKGGNVNLQVGQEVVDRVQNDEGVTINNGQVVYVSGASGVNIQVKLPIASDPSTAPKTFALATEDTANQQHGYVTLIGKVRDLNTSGSLYGETWVDGEILYLSATVSGGLTKVRPTPPNIAVIIGIVTRAHATEGILSAKPIVVQRHSLSSDVLISSIADNDLTYWDNAASVWKNAGIAEIGTSLLPGSVVFAGIDGILSEDNSNLFWDNVNDRLGIGNSTPTFPLSFGASIGDKIALFDNGGSVQYGFGISTNILQIYSDGSGNRVGIGYGTSSTFAETFTVKGDSVGIGTGTNFSDPITGTSKFKAVDGAMVLSFRDHNSGHGWFAVSNGTITAYGGHTQTQQHAVWGTYTNHDVTFRTNNLGIMYMNTSGGMYIAGSGNFGTGSRPSFTGGLVVNAGNVGFGETIPLAKVHINTGVTTEEGLLIKGVASQSADYFNISSSSGDGDIFTVLANGNTGFGEPAPDTRIDVNGAITINELDTDPTDPAEGKAVFWKSDGTDTGDDGDLLYKEQSASVVAQGSLKWKDFTPSSVTLNTGTSASSVSDAQVMFDGNTYDIAEVTGVPGYDVEFNFTNVDRVPVFIIARWRYDGSATHWVTVDIYNYNTVSWDTLRAFSDSSNYFDSMTMYIPRASNGDYVDGSGNSKIRFYHQSSGNAAHDIHIDYVGLCHSLQGVN